MPVRSMTLTTRGHDNSPLLYVSDACQINDFDHLQKGNGNDDTVSDACQINDFDHHADGAVGR